MTMTTFSTIHRPRQNFVKGGKGHARLFKTKAGRGSGLASGQKLKRR